MSGYVGPPDGIGASPLDVTPLPNPLQEYHDQLAVLHGVLTPNAPAPNPVGTSSVQTMGMPGAGYDTVVGTRGDGTPIMQSEIDAIHAQRAAGANLALTTVLGMTGSIKDAAQGDLLSWQAQPNALARAGGEGLALPGGRAVDVRPPTEDVHDTMDASFAHGRVVGDRTVPIDSLSGGVALNDPAQAARVSSLAGDIGGSDGYWSRPIVDTDGNVIEGQHRLEAARQLGVTNVPVHVVQDLAKDVDVPGLDSAIKQAQPGMHGDARSQLIQHMLEARADEGSAAGVREAYDAPDGYQKGWDAGLAHLDAAENPAPKPNPLTVYHGTPHLFPPTETNPLGAFDLGRIGTGEGAQVYGHGLYTAENPDIADWYRRSLSQDPMFDASGTSGSPNLLSQSSMTEALNDFLADDPDLEHVDADTAERAAAHVVERLGFGDTPDQIRASLDSPLTRNALKTPEGREAVEAALSHMQGVKPIVPGPTVGGQRFTFGDPTHEAALAVHEAGGDPDAAIDRLDDKLRPLQQHRDAVTLQGGDPDTAPHMPPINAEIQQLMAQKRLIDDNRGTLPTYKPPGHAYEIELHGQPEEFLDWDKPFAQQSPWVQKALGMLGVPNASHVAGEQAYAHLAGNAMQERDVLQKMFRDRAASGDTREFPEDRARLALLNNPHAAASQTLLDAGVQGIRYLDASSRGGAAALNRWQQQMDGLKDDLKFYDAQLDPNARFPLAEGDRAQMQTARDRAQEQHDRLMANKPPDEGTRNYVVFNPAIMNIVRRYGIGAILPAGAGAGALAGAQSQQ